MAVQLRSAAGTTPATHKTVHKTTHKTTHKSDDEGPLWNETPASVSRTINTYLHSLQIRSTAHTLRHWFATNTYRDSRDIILTQNLMGHADMATTAIYAAADQSKSAGVVFGLRIGGHR